MLDAVAVSEHELDLAPGAIAVLVTSDDDVCRERLEARRDGPDMELVHGSHAVHGAHGAGDRFHVNARRGGFHQDVERLANEAHRRGEDGPAAIAMPINGSIGLQPVVRITAPETITPTEPSASAAE